MDVNGPEPSSLVDSDSSSNISDNVTANNIFNFQAPVDFTQYNLEFLQYEDAVTAILAHIKAVNESSSGEHYVYSSNKSSVIVTCWCAGTYSLKKKDYVRKGNRACNTRKCGCMYKFRIKRDSSSRLFKLVFDKDESGRDRNYHNHTITPIQPGIPTADPYRRKPDAALQAIIISDQEKKVRPQATLMGLSGTSSLVTIREIYRIRYLNKQLSGGNKQSIASSDSSDDMQSHSESHMSAIVDTDTVDVKDGNVVVGNKDKKISQLNAIVTTIDDLCKKIAEHHANIRTFALDCDQLHDAFYNASDELEAAYKECLTAQSKGSKAQVLDKAQQFFTKKEQFQFVLEDLDRNKRSLKENNKQINVALTKITVQRSQAERVKSDLIEIGRRRDPEDVSIAAAVINLHTCYDSVGVVESDTKAAAAADKEASAIRKHRCKKILQKSCRFTKCITDMDLYDNSIPNNSKKRKLNNV